MHRDPLAPLRLPLSKHRATAADVVGSHAVGPSVVVIDFCLFLPAASSAQASSGNTASVVLFAIGCVVLQSQPDQQAIAKIGRDKGREQGSKGSHSLR
jgi:hypothetical protein